MIDPHWFQYWTSLKVSLFFMCVCVLIETGYAVLKSMGIWSLDHLAKISSGQFIWSCGKKSPVNLSAISAWVLLATSLNCSDHLSRQESWPIKLKFRYALHQSLWSDHKLYNRSFKTISKTDSEASFKIYWLPVHKTSWRTHQIVVNIAEVVQRDTAVWIEKPNVR